MNTPHFQTQKNPLRRMRSSFRHWVRRVIIDFDPYDLETAEASADFSLAMSQTSQDSLPINHLLIPRL